MNSSPIIVQRSPLEISLVNRNVASQHFAYLFISSAKQSDAIWGRFEIEIKNNSSQPIVVTQASTLQVHIPKELLTSADLNDIRLEEGSENIWSLSATTKALVLKLKQERLEISSTGAKIFLGNVLASEKAALHRSVTFAWEKFGDIDDNSRSFLVQREFIEEKSTAAEIRCDLAPRSEYLNQADCVYFTPRPPSALYEGVKNRLILRISNQGPALEGEGAEFLISFPTQEYGDARTALCTTDQLKEVKCFPLEQSGWRSDEEKEGESKQWILRPPARSKTVLAKGQILQFEFRGIVTELQDGTAYVLVNWRGINGKNPGYNILPINKLPPFPYVKSMIAFYENKPLPAGGSVYFDEPFSVKWESFATDNCVIQETGEKLDSNYTLNLIADKVLHKVTITPEIAVPAANFIRKGNPVSIEIPLFEPLLDVTKEVQTSSMNHVKLTWQSRGGKVKLSAPVNRQEALEANGAFTTSITGLYKFECVGPKSKTVPVIVNVPNASMTCDARWSADGSKVTLTWTTQNATKLELWAGYNPGSEVKTTQPLQGSYELTTAGLIYCILRASGNGDLVMFVQSPRRGSNFPKMTANESKPDTGPEYRVAWKIEDLKAPFGYVFISGTFLDRSHDWLLSPEGTVETDFKNGTRNYVFMPLNPENDSYVTGLFPTGMPKPPGGGEPLDEMRAFLAQCMKTAGSGAV